MSDKTDIWMPLYIADLIADTMHLDRADFGSYVLLICAYWRRQAPLNDDDAELAAIARVSQCDWIATRNRIAKFFQIGGGEWRHKRIDRELESSKKHKEARRRAGSLGNQVRWGNRSSQPDSQCDGNASPIAIAEGVANPSQNGRPSPSPSSSPIPAPAPTPPPSGGCKGGEVQPELIPNPPACEGGVKKSKARASSMEEVVAYCREVDLPDSDGQYIWDKWQGDGWLNGRNPVKDWKAVIRSWKTACYFPSQKGKHPPTNLADPDAKYRNGF